jgi:hypothetical protein
MIALLNVTLSHFMVISQQFEEVVRKVSGCLNKILGIADLKYETDNLDQLAKCLLQMIDPPYPPLKRGEQDSALTPPF